MTAIEAVRVEPNTQKRLARGFVRGNSLEEDLVLDRRNALINGAKQVVFAREVVIDDARTRVGPLRKDGHGSIMKAALDDQIEHRLQDRFPFIAFASHSSPHWR
jgi:hypothetical protein